MTLIYYVSVYNSINKPNKPANADLNHLVNWLNSNKIPLNVKKLKW